MAGIKSKGFFLIVLLAALTIGYMMLARAPAASLPSISLPAPAAQQAAVGRFAFHSNWGDIGLDIEGALEHAIARHGSLARNALEMARKGHCKPYLPCGSGWDSLFEGLKGYFLCQLSNGQTWLVPFLADSLMLRLVGMSAYPVRPSYEPRVRVRGDCAPVELISAVFYDGGEYDDDRDADY